MRHARAGAIREDTLGAARPPAGIEVAFHRGMLDQLKNTSFLPHLLGLTLLLGLSACYVEADGPRPPPRCADAHWIRGHHDRYGDWRPGHYSCRADRVVVVVP